MILGLSLVIDELHKGQRLVFRYPESNPYINKEIYKDAHQDLINNIFQQYFAMRLLFKLILRC